jgi:hypothetical protein
MFIPDHGSRIPDPTTATKVEREKNFEQVKKKYYCQFTKSYNTKIVTKLSKI